LVVNVAVDGLETQQQKHLQAHECESGGGDAEAGTGSGSLTVLRQPAKASGDREQEQPHGDNHGTEAHARRGMEHLTVAVIEPLAPKGDIEIVGYRCEIAVDGRIREWPDLQVEIGHAVRHHAEGNVILANIAGAEMPRLQS